MLRLHTLDTTIDVSKRRVLVRCDFDVPLVREKKGAPTVGDDARLRVVAATVERLARRGARVVLMGHLGRPDGKVVRSLSLQPVAEHLATLLTHRVGHLSFAGYWHPARLERASRALKPGALLMIENLRFRKGEEENDATFATELARLGDLYVNESFANSHRRHASMVGVPKRLPAYAGWGLAAEVENLHRVLTAPRRPLVLFIGGRKVEDKIPMMVNLAARADAILLGGAPANTMLKLSRVAIGVSPVAKPIPVRALQQLSKVRRTFGGKRQQPLVYLPDDVVASSLKPGGAARWVDFSRGESVKARERIVDLGPKTVLKYAAILKRAGTIIWSGPPGVFEEPPFDQGSRALAWLIAARSRGPAYGVVGGGETLAVLDSTGMAEYVDHRSLGGGAMLELLAGRELPALAALSKNHR